MAASMHSGAATVNSYRFALAGNRRWGQIDTSVSGFTSNNLSQLTGQSPGGPMEFADTGDKRATITLAGRTATVEASGTWRETPDVTSGANAIPLVATNVNGNTTTKTINITVSGGASRTLIYDLDGELLNNGAGKIYAYDATNQLVSITLRSNVTAFGCNGLGQRVRGELIRSVIKPWKVYGPDLNGKYGGLQGTGGLEAVILDADGTTTGVINDQFGNGVATVTGTGSSASVTWNTTRVGAYGPLPGIQAQTLTDVTQVAASTAWRSRRMDPTGFYWLGARYYEPTSGRFLSADPMGQAASPSLYDYAGGDPVNSFDPDGRVNLELINPNDPAMTGDKYYNPKGVYTVSAHGSPTVIQEWVNMPGMPGGGWIQNMSPSGLAGQMAANGYTPGTPVILLSCQTGLYGPYLGSGNIAGQLSQQLSQQNQTPTIVVAPQSFEWTNPSTGEQASGLLPYWDSSSGNVSQNATNWNVYYDGVRVGTLSTDMINSPLVTDYINNTVALWQLRQMDNKLEGLEDEEAKLDELDSEMSGSAASKSSNCGGCSN